MTQRIEINHSHPSSWLQQQSVGGGCDGGGCGDGHCGDGNDDDGGSYGEVMMMTMRMMMLMI